MTCRGESTLICRLFDYITEKAVNLTELLKVVKDSGQRFIDAHNEDLANEALSAELLIEVFRHELAMLLDFKRNNSDKAWEHLVDAQEFAQFACNAHSKNREYCKSYIDRLKALLEELYFYEPQFCSHSFVIKTSICSICKEEYGKNGCNHFEGLPYMGKICQRVLRGISTYNHTALVENPMTKKHRIKEYQNQGVTWNLMTGDVIEFDLAPVDAPDREVGVVCTLVSPLEDGPHPVSNLARPRVSCLDLYST